MAAIAYWVQSLFAPGDPVPTLVGGAAVELYTGGAYQTGDLDFVGVVTASVAQRMEGSGFARRLLPSPRRADADTLGGRSMGTQDTMKRYVAPPTRPVLRRTGLIRRKPRAYEEWRALRRWGRVPPWETDPPGYLLREAREAAGFTQGTLAGRLGRTQQAVAQAERFTSNPTVEFVREWARALGQSAVLEFTDDEVGAAWLSQE